jgi:ABC-type multidrug transport system fused ATPase/permease subunit
MDFDDYNGDSIWFGSQSATIFVAVSICILITLCISWLIFYYCQRHRARTAKDRLQNRLSNAAKKALTKIPLVNVTENPQTEESCVICLDTIKAGDTVRQLGIDKNKKNIFFFFFLKNNLLFFPLFKFVVIHFIIIVLILGYLIIDIVHYVISIYLQHIVYHYPQQQIIVVVNQM